MSALKAVKAALAPGSTWLTTNHYINDALGHNDGFPRTDKSGKRHAAYGVDLPRTVERVNSSRVYFTNGSYLDWPKASQVQVQADGVIRMFGGGIKQGPQDLFITLRPEVTA